MVTVKQLLIIGKMNVLPFLLNKFNTKLFMISWKEERENFRRLYLRTRIKDCDNKTFNDLDEDEKKVVFNLEKELALLYDIQINRAMPGPRELIEDYQIAIITVGYIIFFSSAAPISIIILLFLTLLKIGGDAYDFNYNQKRPIFEPVKDFQSWTTILYYMAWSSITANSAFVYFTVDGLDYFLPSIGSDLENDRRNFWVVVAAEHLIGLL